MAYMNPVTRKCVKAGLYHVTQFREEKGVTHTGILDVGNRVGIPGLPAWSEPMVMHRPPGGLRVEPLSKTGVWHIVERVQNEAAAIARIRDDAATNPEYNLWASNCEHFTQYAVTGVRQSPQLRKVLGVVAVVALVAWGISKLPASSV